MFHIFIASMYKGQYDCPLYINAIINSKTIIYTIILSYEKSSYNEIILEPLF